VSLERLVDSSKDGYYDTLRESSRGWHRGRHDVWPWLEYLLGVVQAGYGELDERIGVLEGRGAKAEAIDAFVRSVPVGAEFSVADVRRNAAGSSDSHISKVLARLRDAGVISSVGRGRGARWRRLPGD
jgi:DNA-binding transcriptional ArsR family regulator